MKIVSRIFCGLFVFILSFVSQKSFAEEIIHLTNGEWPPYQSEKLKYYGLSSRIITESFAAVGVKVEYGFFPWKRSLFLVENGDWDGSGLWAYSDDRAAYSLYSEPSLEFKWVFFHLKDFKFDWKTIDDLKGITIGTIHAYEYGKDFMTAIKEKKVIVEEVIDDVQNIRKLLVGRIDLSLFEVSNALHILQSEFTKEERDKITYHPLPLTTQPLHLIISKKAEDPQKLIDLFNKGLKQLKESGKLDQYISESQKGEY